MGEDMEQTALQLLRELFADDAPWSLSDWVYHVRSKAAKSGDNFEGSSWEHPHVLRYTNLLERCEKLLAKTKRLETKEQGQ